MSGRKFFVGGNFKMNGTVEGIKGIIQNLTSAKTDPNTEVVIAPPSIYLSPAQSLLSSSQISVAAQNVFDKPSGAFTGEICPSQLVDLGIHWTILGHSERRTILKESDEFVASKTKHALEAGVKVILCVGESLEEREKGETVGVVERQLGAVLKEVGKEEGEKGWGGIVVAYEPIWAIGTGKTATTSQAQEVHSAIRSYLSSSISSSVAEKTRIIYGGSVSEKNCVDLAKEKDIDGFLVGGASLKPAFVEIVNARQAS